MDILITNNPRVKAEFESTIEVEFLETDLLGVLTYVRDLVHKGHRLLTHPLSGSIKPNETIYKSVLITSSAGTLDIQSVNIIGESILTAQKFPKRQFTDEYLSDMQTVDLSLIKSALSNHTS